MLLFGASRASFPNAKLCYSSILPRHDEFQSKVSKFNVQADKQCENCAVEFLNNTKIFNDVDNYVYKKDPTECVQLTREGKASLAMHFVCFIEDSVPEGEVFREPKMIIGPKLETKLPKEGIEVRNLTPVNEDQDEREEGTNGTVPHGPRPLGDGGKVKGSRDRDGDGDGSQSPLPPTPTSNPSNLLSSSPLTTPQIPIGQSSSSNEISQLISLVRQQSSQIEKLQKEVRQRNAGSARVQGPDYGSAKDIDSKFNRLSNEIKQLQRLFQSQNERLTNGTHSQKPTDAVVEQILPSITTRLLDAVERVTMSKLNQTDNVIKDQLQKTLNSTGMSTAIGRAVESAVQSSNRGSLDHEIVPKFEKATKEMFSQIAQTFSKGTEDYMSRLERSLDRRVKAEVSQLESTIAKAEDPSGRLSVNLTQNLSKSLQVQISSEIAKSNAKFQQENTQMIHQMFNMLRGQMVADIKKLLQTHTDQLDTKVEEAIVRAQTPGPVSEENMSLRGQLRLMLEQKKYNEAFTKALMASDLPLVVELMEMVDSSKIFSPDLPGGTALEQNIILSLIQQLSVDLRTKSQVKFPFLQESILALDIHRPSAEHIPNVLKQLQDKIVQFMETWPRDPMAKNYRMLAMTAAGMVKSPGQMM